LYEEYQMLFASLSQSDFCPKTLSDQASPSNNSPNGIISLIQAWPGMRPAVHATDPQCHSL